jgi:hypothetical protein
LAVLTAPGNYTLPLASSVPSGASISFASSNTGCILKPNGTDVINVNGSNAANLTFNVGDTLTLVRNPVAGTWVAIDGSVQAPYSAGLVAMMGQLAGGVAPTGASIALDNTYLGKYVSLAGALAQTASLPLLSGVSNGAQLLIHNPTTFLKTVTVQGSDVISPEGNTYTSILLGQGDTVLFTKESGVWRAYGTGVLKYAAQFAATVNSAGYQRLPSGLIEEWGQFNSVGTANPNTTITFPVAFPNACIGCFPSIGGTTLGTWIAQVATTSKTGATLSCQNNGAMATAVGGSYYALGY